MGVWRRVRDGLRVAAVLGIATFAALATVAAAPPRAAALASRFSINDGAAYARSLRVGVGDHGWSPFFDPGVVVWDGGSILSGIPTYALDLMPQTCTSYVSWSPGATIASMIAEAPAEVDAHYDAEADLDLCVVLAGGGDFDDDVTAQEVYDGLRAYCTGRRAAGFTVVVLTVLPRSDPATFEAARQAYNDLLRGHWTEFADGLADIAADSRIGDPGDNLDRQFYREDGVHPNARGNSVMASIVAPVLNALAWRSSSCEMRFREEGGGWTSWRPYAADSTWWFSEGDGVRTIEAEYTDGGPVVALTDSIQVDTVRPTTEAHRTVRVRRGRTATFRYIVNDALPCGPTTNVIIKIANGSGKVVKQVVRRNQAVNAELKASFVCRLPKGAYRWIVTARDTAGNPQSTAGRAPLKVR